MDLTAIVATPTALLAMPPSQAPDLGLPSKEGAESVTTDTPCSHPATGNLYRRRCQEGISSTAHKIALSLAWCGALFSFLRPCSMSRSASRHIPRAPTRATQATDTRPNMVNFCVRCLAGSDGRPANHTHRDECPHSPVQCSTCQGDHADELCRPCHHLHALMGEALRKRVKTDFKRTMEATGHKQRHRPNERMSAGASSH